MLIAAAVVPHPPVLVPELAQGLAPDLDPLRAACETAISRLYAAKPDRLVVVGVSPTPEIAATGGLHRYGVDLAVAGGWPGPEEADAADATDATDAANEAAEMPLPFLIGAWLLRDRPQEPERVAVGVSEEDDAPALGRRLAAGPQRDAMLVLGDGTACRNIQAPGYFDERAEDYDAVVTRALAGADTAVLAGLDPVVSRALHVAGRPAWQVLAGAAEATGSEFSAELLYDEAPYGVGYFVSTWLAA